MSESRNDSTEAPWEKTLHCLSDSRRDLLERWFLMQDLIAGSLGLSQEDWFGYVAWALENLGDFSFVEDHPDRPNQPGGLDDVATRKRAAQLLGLSSRLSPAPSGEPAVKKTVEPKLEKELYHARVISRCRG